MTKFEEEAIKEAKKCGVAMSYYERGCGAPNIGLNLKLERGVHNFPWLEFAKNWHSDEEFQEMKESYWNQAESILSMLDEIKSLKSQLQQQALPVVPECVAEWIDRNISVAHNAELMIHNILICAVDNKNRYLFPLEVEKFVLKNPITFLNAVITGKYEVEKPQLFYLKNKLTGMYLYKKALGGYGEDPSSSIKYLTDDFKFTKKEIDSMETGSYKKIEVEG